jgi:hypothetical protein
MIAALTGGDVVDDRQAMLEAKSEQSIYYLLK